MKIVGLTGGIACGKSTVAQMFGALGATILSADEDARDVLTNGSSALAAVRRAFPSAFDADGNLVRAQLGQLIFSDLDARRHLESLMHPEIIARMKSAIETARARNTPKAVLIYETPLLYEAELQRLFDVVVAAVASPKVQAMRLQEREQRAGRSPLTESAIAERLAAQIPVEEKARRADFVVRTDGSLVETEKAVKGLWANLATLPTPKRQAASGPKTGE